MSASGWEIKWSSSRQMAYYYNHDTKASQWEEPAGVDVHQLPGKENLNKASSAPLDHVRASHLLVKHRGSRNPSSWKEAHITRSEEEARDILEGYQAQLRADPNRFAELAEQHSDCSSHSRGGDLNFFQRGMMQKPFEDAAFALQVGQMSDIVSTQSGLHIILRTA